MEASKDEASTDEAYLLLETIENAIIEAYEKGVEIDLISSAMDELLYNLSMGRE